MFYEILKKVVSENTQLALVSSQKVLHAADVYITEAGVAIRKYGFTLFAPFFDAYVDSSLSVNVDTDRNAFYDPDLQMEPLSKIEDVARAMALGFGVEVIGECVIKGYPLPKYNGRAVLFCIKTFLDKENTQLYKTFLITVPFGVGEGWYKYLEFVEGPILEGWDSNIFH